MTNANRVYDSRFLLRCFTVSVTGFPEATYFATSRNQALSSAWQNYCASLGYTAFKDFLKIARAKNCEPEDRFGELIMVGGQEAFYVSYNGHYVQFALPHRKNYSNSHPLDVTMPSGEPFKR